MTRKQQAEYEKTCERIKEYFISFNNIAIRSVQITDEAITGETIRVWFAERKIPADFVFVLYEMMDEEIDPMTLLPNLQRWLVMK